MFASPKRSEAADFLVAAAQREIDASRRLRSERAESPTKSVSPRRSSPGREAMSSPRVPNTFALSPHDGLEKLATTRIHTETLEDALMRVRSLLAEVAVLRGAIAEADAARVEATGLWENEARRRSETEAQLQAARETIAQQTSAVEGAERRASTLSTTLSQLTDELHQSNSDVQRLQQELSHSRELQRTLSNKLEASEVSEETTQRRLRSAEQKIATLGVESLDWRHKHETLVAELADTHRRHDASEVLRDAQHSAALAEHQTEKDELTRQLQLMKDELDHETARHRAELQVNATRIANLELTLESVNRTLHEMQEEAKNLSHDVSRGKTERDGLQSRLQERETALSERLVAASAAASAERDQKEAALRQISELQDINHILAVRLKSATAEKEALEMESEARKLLARQNEEMERQLIELRRTIHSLMGTSRLAKSPGPS